MTASVLFETELGDFTVEVDTERAPTTAANFLAYVDGGYLDHAFVFRIVTMTNQKPDTLHKIQVVQWGLQASEANPAPFAPIVHETTSMTGLRHRDMTISMARFGPGTADSEFSICVGDQAELDYGGRRNPDGQGFAAFGSVTSGRETIMKIFAKAEDQEYLVHPLRFLGARRLANR